MFKRRDIPPVLLLLALIVLVMLTLCQILGTYHINTCTHAVADMRASTHAHQHALLLNTFRIFINTHSDDDNYNNDNNSNNDNDNNNNSYNNNNDNNNYKSLFALLLNT